LYYISSFERYQQGMTKWVGVPFAQASAGLARAMSDYEAFRTTHPDNPLLQVLTAYQKVLLATVRVDRRVDELRCLEAIRAYAATHEGKLPASLGEVKEAPVPNDPITGEPFLYVARGGDEARLDAPVPAGGTERDGRRYELLRRQ
jgi:hypothetical protein